MRADDDVPNSACALVTPPDADLSGLQTAPPEGESSEKLREAINRTLIEEFRANFAYRGYQQAFGVLSLLIVVMTYLYVASVAFLVGAELDALLVTEATKGRRR